MESIVINPTRLKQLRDRAAQEKVSVDALLERWLDSTAEQPRVAPLEQQGSLLQQISDAIVVTNRKLEITGWNQAATDIYGWTEAEAIGQEIHHLLKTAWTTETQAQAQAMLAETGIYRGEIQQQTRGGNPLYIQSSGSWIKDAAGEIIRSVTVNRDVTERKQDEKLQALLSQVLQSVASERSLPYILDQLLQGIEAYQPGMKGSILLLDTDTNRLHHGAAPSLPGSYNAAIDGIEIGPRVGSCGTAAFEQRRVIVEDIQTDPLWVDFRDLAAEHGLRACWSQPIVQQDGTVLGTLALYYTQTKTPTQREIKLIEMAAHIAGIAIQQKQREGELRASEERLRGLSDATFEAIFLSHKGICLDQNRAAEEMFGYALDEAVGRYGTEWIVPEDRETVMHNMLSGYEEPYQVTALRKDRSTFPVEIRGKMITYKGQPVRVTALHDISERKQVEDALRKSEERFRTVADWTYDWEYWVGPEGEIFYMSPSCERVTGYPASAFVVDPDLLRHTVHLDDRSAWDQHHRLYRTNPAEQKTGQLEYRIVTPDGTIRWIDHLCRPVFSREGDYRGHRVSSRDITERKQASTALRESEARFRHYMENLPGAVFLKDDQDRLIYCNRFYASLVGSAPAALIGRLSSEYTDDIELNRRFMDENRQVLQEGQPGTFIHAYQTPNGESYWQTVKFPVELPNGSRQIGAISLDVTNRKRVEEALRQSEEAYRGVVEDTPMLLCRFLPEGEITFVNQAYCNYHARTSEELVGYNFLEFLPEPDRSFVLANLAALTAESPTQTHEHGVMAPNGEVRWQRWTNRALFDAQGKIIAYQSVGEDVTEQRSMREWLDLQNVALEAAANAIAVTDIEGRIQWVNPAFTTLTGYTLAEARGQKPSILKSGKHDVAFYQSLWDTILSGQVWQGQSTNRRKDGSLYTEEQTITPVRDRHGKISHFISIKQDVTERVQVEQLHLE